MIDEACCRPAERVTVVSKLNFFQAVGVLGSMHSQEDAMTAAEGAMDLEDQEAEARTGSHAVHCLLQYKHCECRWRPHVTAQQGCCT